MRRKPMRLTAAVAVVIMLISGLIPGGAARAENAPGDAVGSVPPVIVEATIDAGAVTAGTLRVSVICRGLPAGRMVWTLPDGAEAHVADARLADAGGSDTALTVERTGVAAQIGPGDWTLTYELPVAAVADGVVVTPAACLLLPPAAAVTLSVVAPPGWTVAANLPVPSQNMGGFRLRAARFLLAPDAPRIITTLDCAAAKVILAAADEGAACRDDQLTAFGELAGAFAAAVPAVATAAGPAGEPLGDTAAELPAVTLFVTEEATPEDLAIQLLDALWAVHGPRPADGPDSPTARLIDAGAWPLLRDLLLKGAGFVPAAVIAREICAEHRLFMEAPAGVAPLVAAPLASLYFVAGELADGPRQLVAAVIVAASGEGTGAGGGFVDRLAATLALAGDPAAAASAELLLKLAGRGTDEPVGLPDLPDDILAAGDPDSDGDGLPDRIDPDPTAPGIAIIVAGRLVRLDVEPLNIGGRIMVPLRFLAERLGFAVSWDDAARTARVARSGRDAQFPVGTHYYLTDGQAHYLDAPTVIVDGRAMVSLRFAARAMDVGVAWDGAAKTVSVQPDQPYADATVQPAPGLTAYLTFDDGPEPAMTPAVLSVLDAYQVRATFFVLGSVAAGRGELLRRILAAGCALGNHTYSHDTGSASAGFVYRSPDAYLAELAACDRVIAAATGLHPRASRPPGGSYPHLTEEFRVRLRAAGYLTYDWDVSAADSALPRPTIEQVITNIMAGARDGARRRLVILMHDGGREHQTTLAALPAVIEYLRGCGYDFGLLAGAATASGGAQ